MTDGIYERRDEILAELEKATARIDERTKVLPEIQRRLLTLNGGVAAAMKEACLARKEAEEADKKATRALNENRGLLKWATRTSWALLAALVYLVLEWVWDVI